MHYSYPYKTTLTPGLLGLTPAEFCNTHEVTIRTFDQQNRSNTVVTDRPFLGYDESIRVDMNFNDPWRRITLYSDGPTLGPTSITVNVSTAEIGIMSDGSSYDFGPGLTLEGGHLVETNIQLDHVSFSLDRTSLGSEHTPLPGTEYEYERLIDCTGLSTGYHFLVAGGYTATSAWPHGSARLDIAVEKRKPAIYLDRTVSTNAYWFEVELELTNHGSQAAELKRVVKWLEGFQACPQITSPAGSTASIHWRPIYNGSQINVAFPNNTMLLPGESIIISYHAVPIMFPTVKTAYAIRSAMINYQEGMDGLSIAEEFEGAAMLEDRRPIQEAVDAATAQCDYLIVAAPGRMLAHYSEGSVNDLLATAAELARQRQGVLGYYDTYSIYGLPRSLEDPVAFGDMFSVSHTGDEVFIADLSAYFIRPFHLPESRSKLLEAERLTP